MDNYFDEYLKARDEAVKSMDVEKFKAYVREYSICLTEEDIENDLLVAALMRRLAMSSKDIDIDTKVEAYRWLLEHGFDIHLEE